ncbi:MAG: hypothetical protein GXO99_06960 [Nitrospirae bacterium]|nr:hypothetical protein [Nitrospirota bacterium]
MKEFKTEGLKEEIAERFVNFLKDVLAKYSDNLHSVHLIGSALTPDYIPGVSDINSIFVLKEMDLGFLKLLAPLGKKYKKTGIAAPLIMTPRYIENSLDVFPIEFFDFRLIHHTIVGEDILVDLKIEKKYLRLQAERELKSKLIWLRQGYLSTMGDKKLLVQNLINSITGFFPLFRAIIYLLGQAPPVERHQVVVKLQELTNIKTSIYEKILLIKREQAGPGKNELDRAFEDYYRATEKIGRLINDLEI